MGGGGNPGKGEGLQCVGVSCNNNKLYLKWCLCFQGPEINAGSDLFFFISLFFFPEFFFFSPFSHATLAKGLFQFCA